MRRAPPCSSPERLPGRRRPDSPPLPGRSPPERIHQLPSAVQIPVNLPQKAGDGGNVKALVNGTAEIDVKVHTVLPVCHRRPLGVQGEDSVFVAAKSLAHRGDVLEKIVLPIQMEGVQAVFPDVGNVGKILPENAAIPVQDMELIVLHLLSGHAGVPDRLQLHGLRLSVVVEVIALRQGLHRALPGLAGDLPLLCGEITGVAGHVLATLKGQIQTALPLPLPPGLGLMIRRKSVLRNGAPVRQGEVPGGPVLRLKDGDGTPGPGGQGQGQISALRGPKGQLAHHAVRLPQHFLRRAVHHLDLLRHPDTTDIEIRLPNCADQKSPVRGDGLPLHLRQWRGLQQLLICPLPVGQVLRRRRRAGVREEYPRRQQEQYAQPDDLSSFHDDPTSVVFDGKMIGEDRRYVYHNLVTKNNNAVTGKSEGGPEPSLGWIIPLPQPGGRPFCPF